MKDFPCLFIYHKKKVNFEENHFKCEPINPPGCLSLQGTKFCRDKPINQTAKMSNFEMDSFTTKNGKSLKITFFKHASLLLDYAGQKIFIDPVSDYADYTQQPKADFILITHEHGDHFDTKAIAAIETNQTKIIANPNCRKMLNRGQEMKNGDVLQLAKDIKLEAVPAYNTTPGRDKFHPKGRDNGYILTLGGTRIYIAGDTEDIPELNQVKDIDIAFLPVNQPYTMTPEQAIRAAKIIKPRVLYPYHYGETDIHKQPRQTNWKSLYPPNIQLFYPPAKLLPDKVNRIPPPTMP